MPSGSLYDTYELYDALTKNLCRIIFKKVTNGSLRFMLCSLSLDFIPKHAYSDAIKIISNPEEFIKTQKIVVWDIESNDWRSFYKNSVISVNISVSDNAEKEKKRIEKEKEEENNESE